MRLVALLPGLSAAALLIAPLHAQRAPTSPPASDTARAAGSALFTIGDALDVVSYNAADLTKDGRWLAATSTSRRDALGVDFRRDGDPTYVRPARLRVWIIDTQNGKAQPVFPDKRNVRALSWSPDGSRLGLLVHRGEAYEPVIVDRATGKQTAVRVPAGKYVAENSDLRWTSDGRSLVFSLHTDAWKRKAQAQFARQTAGPVFVQSSKDPFLAWDDMRRAGNVRSIAAYELASGAMRELVPEAMIASYNIAEDGGLVTYNEDITKKTDYDVIGGSENKLVARPLSGGDARTLLPTLKATTLVWAKDGRHYAYAKDGRVWVASVDDKEPRQVAGLPAKKDGAAAPDSSSADTSKAARAERDKQRFTLLRYSPKGDAILVSNREAIWLLDVASGTKEKVVDVPDSTSTEPRTSVVAWSEDGRSLYLGSASRTKWERGLLRYDRDGKRVEELVKDGRTYSGLRLSDDGKVSVLSIAEGNRPADLFVADAGLKNPRRLIETNPQLRERRFGKTELLQYLDADGHREFGVVYYPANYDASKRYPTVFNIYEDFFDDTFDATVNVLTANGYLVVKPSVDFDIGYPGEAWVKGVTSAANKLIEMGVADSARLGVHGTSYGGYATNLLITQTNRFKAAINISGKVDVISFYTDSPRLGVRNVHAAEKSQDRLGATLWQQPQKYVQQSAIMFADRIQTPLLLMTGNEDQNVPAGNTREMYYALRRLGKEVVWANYMNGGHGTPATTEEDFTDFHKRILEWYDGHLKKDAAKKTASLTPE